MKTIIKVLVVVVLAGTIAVAWNLGVGGSDVGLAKDAPAVVFQTSQSLSAMDLLPPSELQSGPAKVLRDPLHPVPQRV